jgi:hypothetical protein
MSNAGLKITKAAYGVQGNFTDVTKEVQSMIVDGGLNFTVSAQSLGILDPAPGVKKSFQAQTIINGGTPSILSKEDGEQFVISAPAPKKGPTGPLAGSLSIFGYIFYGIGIFLFISYIFFTIGSGYQIGLAIGNQIIGVIFAILAPALYIPMQIIVFFYSLIFGGTLTFKTAELPLTSIPITYPAPTAPSIV